MSGWTVLCQGKDCPGEPDDPAGAIRRVPPLVGNLPTRYAETGTLDWLATETLTEYLHDVGYYTYADVHSDIVLPNSGFDEYQVFDESLVDLKQRHSDLIEKMKIKTKEEQSFFLYLHYSSIHTGIMNSVLKAYDNFSKEYFGNRKLNEKRYDVGQKNQR